ncbi:hypothetical protein [uncultured Tessaracoccus sp.]|uniref:hypothetical protein n=1 Tax=uncultured Tessaracoccus sp. TaxID=905023 RepID=UPI002636A464|nr:hypothetical protein [uncultured Tessaracoccus sp.]
MSSETYWTQANLDAELVDLSGQAFLWLGERRSVAMQVTVLQHSHFPSVTARCVNPDERPLRIWTRSFVLRGQTLGDANPDDATPLEVLRMPPWELEGNNLTVVQVRRWSLLPILAIIVSATVLAQPLVLLALFLVPLLVWARKAVNRAGGLTVRSLEGMPLNEHNLVDYALARQRGENPRGLRGIPRIEEARERVEKVRSDYGERKSDIVYRIEQPALFDASAPTTEAFLVALWEFDQIPDDAPPREAEEAAARVEVTYGLARRHAETVGIRHVAPEKADDVRRAAKVARLAVASGSEGERAAARAQLSALLASLSLHFLPDAAELRALDAPETEPGGNDPIDADR